MRTVLQQKNGSADLNTSKIWNLFNVHYTGFLRTAIFQRPHTPDLRTLIIPRPHTTPLKMVCPYVRVRFIQEYSWSRGTSLIRNRHPTISLCLQPYGGPRGGGAMCRSEVPLWRETTHLARICAVQVYLAHKKFPSPQGPIGPFSSRERHFSEVLVSQTISRVLRFATKQGFSSLCQKGHFNEDLST